MRLCEGKRLSHSVSGGKRVRVSSDKLWSLRAAVQLNVDSHLAGAAGEEGAADGADERRKRRVGKERGRGQDQGAAMLSEVRCRTGSNELL